MRPRGKKKDQNQDKQTPHTVLQKLSPKTTYVILSTVRFTPTQSTPLTCPKRSNGFSWPQQPTIMPMHGDISSSHLWTRERHECFEHVQNFLFATHPFPPHHNVPRCRPQRTQMLSWYFQTNPNHHSRHATSSSSAPVRTHWSHRLCRCKPSFRQVLVVLYQ